ncbi:hypothetical protein BY996DRAFT_6871370 [Phakopsora pachyrhizi]|nr:hypothetical protein BY996DRAFT_6871370 [Phakopsora pachyrhizi]
MGTGEFYIPIKDIYEFFQKRVYINSKYENLMDLRTNKYDDKIIAKLPKQILQKIEADLKESTICKQGNIGRYLNYFLRKKLASIEIRNSFISISNIINKVFGNSREEIINNFKKNQKTAIDFFDNILSRVDFRTQNMKDLQVKKGKKTINQFELSFKMQNHLEFNKNSAKNFKPELENTIAMEEAKTVEKVSMFFANNNFADSFTKAITSKILIQWLKIHRPQILINLNPTDEKDRESHTLLLFCRRFLNIMAALDVLEKD